MENEYSQGFCISDLLNWKRAADEMSGNHKDEVKKMISDFRTPLVKLEGSGLRIAQVAGGAAGPAVRVELDDSARDGVKKSSDWIMDRLNRGIDVLWSDYWIWRHVASPY